MYNIHLLPASFGDSILVEYGDTAAPKYILIDGGPYFNFKKLMKGMMEVTPNLKELELLIVTHIDIDHIDGIVRLLNTETLAFKIKEIWFNGYKQLNNLPDDSLGVIQGDYLSELINKHLIPQNIAYFNGMAIMVSDFNQLPHFKLDGGMEITLLGPGEEALRKLKTEWEKQSKYINNLKALTQALDKDKRYKSDLLGDDDIAAMQQLIVEGDTSLANRSSIAFIGRYEGKSCLFSGDLPSADLLTAINPLLISRDEYQINLDAWKIAHHGSKKSTLNELIKKIRAKKILISSNGTRFKHPHPEVIAKLLGYTDAALELYFNYKSNINQYWDNDNYKTNYSYQTFFPEKEAGISIKL